MRNWIFPLLIAAVLLLAGCDLADTFGGKADGSPSDAQQVLEGVQPFVPNGWPRLVVDVALLLAAFASRKLSKRELAANEAREYNTEEAASMLAAIKQHKAELAVAKANVDEVVPE